MSDDTVLESLKDYREGIKIFVQRGIPYSKKDPQGIEIRKALKRVIQDYTPPRGKK